MTQASDKDERKQDGQTDNPDKHLPEWVRIFRELRDEAEQLYPDGRIRILIPGRRRRPPAAS